MATILGDVQYSQNGTVTPTPEKWNHEHVDRTGPCFLTKKMWNCFTKDLHGGHTILRFLERGERGPILFHICNEKLWESHMGKSGKDHSLHEKKQRIRFGGIITRANEQLFF